MHRFAKVHQDWINVKYVPIKNNYLLKKSHFITENEKNQVLL